MGDNYTEMITGRGIKTGESIRMNSKDVAILKVE